MKATMALLAAAMALAGCTGQPTGNEAGVSIRSPSEAHAFQTATEWCGRYGKSPKLMSAATTWAYECVPKG
jgi:hypothetical protein